MGKTIVGVGAILGGFAVLIGAFGAHGLRAKVSEEMLAVYRTGVEYHFYHALALIGLGLFVGQSAPADPPAAARAAAWCFVAGVVIFSGSLYLMTLTGARWLGAITPIGGLSFVAGWVLFAWLASIK